MTAQRSHLKHNTLMHCDETQNGFSRLFDKRLSLNSIAITVRLLISVSMCVTCKIFLTAQRSYLKLNTFMHCDNFRRFLLTASFEFYHNYNVPVFIPNYCLMINTKEHISL